MNKLQFFKVLSSSSSKPIPRSLQDPTHVGWLLGLTLQLKETKTNLIIESLVLDDGISIGHGFCALHGS